jgi:hypothetical protein
VQGNLNRNLRLPAFTVWQKRPARKKVRRKNCRSRACAQRPPQIVSSFPRMRISRHCQLFVFAILIGLAAVLLPRLASAQGHVLTDCAGGEAICLPQSDRQYSAN